MSYVHKRKTQGGRYYVRWMDNGKVKAISTGCKSRIEADSWHEAWKRNRGMSPSYKVFTVKDLFQRKLSDVELNHKPKTLVMYRYIFRLYIQLCGDGLLNKVLPEDLIKYKTLRSRQVSKVSVNIEVRILKTTMKYSCSRQVRMLKENPFSDIEQFKISDRKKVYIPDSDLKKILDSTVNPELKEIFIIGSLTAMRRGEILSLKYKNIDLDNRCIIIDNDADFETKTKQYRTIYLSDKLYAIFLGYFQDESGNAILHSPDQKIFKASPDLATKTFKKIVRKLQLPDSYKFHSLRHTAITNLLRKGNVSIAQEVAGHSSIKTTQLYLHNIPDEVKAAMNAL